MPTSSILFMFSVKGDGPHFVQMLSVFSRDSSTVSNNGDGVWQGGCWLQESLKVRVLLIAIIFL